MIITDHIPWYLLTLWVKNKKANEKQPVIYEFQKQGCVERREGRENICLFLKEYTGHSVVCKVMFVINITV